MGTVYKIKPEIAAFIVEQKKADPRLSCRKLVDIVKRQFNKNLSKSSINTVLKETGLSSPVGRRSDLPGRSRQFRIPENKKHTMLKVNGSEEGSSSGVPAGSGEAKGVANGYKEMSKTSSLDIFKQKKPDIVRFDKAKDGAGAYFLKAVEEEFVQGSLVGGLIRELSGIPLKFQEETGRLLTFGPLFGVHGPEDLAGYNGQGLWELSEARPKSVGRELDEILAAWKDTAETATRFSVEVSQAFTEAAAVRLFFEHGREVLMDARCGALWPQDAPAPFAVSLNRTVGVAASRILGNSQPLVLGTACAGKELSAGFFRLAAGLAGADGQRLVRVSVCDGLGREVAGFSSVPQKRRIFLAGVWPWQTAFSQLRESAPVSPMDSCQADEMGGAVFFRETSFFPDGLKEVAPSLRVRAILVHRKIDGPADVGVITNAAPDELSAAETVKTFVRSWPGLESNIYLKMIRGYALQEDIPSGYTRPPALEESLADSVLDRSGAESTAGPGPFVLGRLWLKALHQQCVRVFFPPAHGQASFEEMSRKVYCLPGRVAYEKRRVLITLDGVDKSGSDELAFAAGRLNERAIVDKKNRQLVVRLLYK